MASRSKVACSVAPPIIQTFHEHELRQESGEEALYCRTSANAGHHHRLIHIHCPHIDSKGWRCTHHQHTETRPTGGFGNGRADGGRRPVSSTTIITVVMSMTMEVSSFTACRDVGEFHTCLVRSYLNRSTLLCALRVLASTMTTTIVRTMITATASQMTM